MALVSDPGFQSATDGFDACYEGAQEGADPLTGDPGDCADLHPAGADLWQDLVTTVCSACPGECCHFCSSPWGVLVP